MTREQIYDEIHKICKLMESYSELHSGDEEKIRSESMKQSETLISMILNSAKSAAKHSYQVYESFRVQLADSAATCAQYETAIHKLADILEV